MDIIEYILILSMKPNLRAIKQTIFKTAFNITECSYRNVLSHEKK